ncbi:hypothetical protein BDV06DRAFT_222322 [Aspergillus oleicola]
MRYMCDLELYPEFSDPKIYETNPVFACRSCLEFSVRDRFADDQLCSTLSKGGSEATKRICIDCAFKDGVLR